MQYMSADMFHNVLSKRAIECDCGVAFWTCQFEMIEDAGIGIDLLHHKTRFS
jgi:hypothetical protein